MPEEDLDALSGAACAFGRVDAGGEPEGDAGVPEIVGPLGEFESVFVEGEGSFAGAVPGDAVGGGVDVVAFRVAEDAAVRCDTEVFDVFAQDADEYGWDGYGPGGFGGASFQGVDFVD